MISDVRSRLIADAAVAALVVARVYPSKLPQKVTLPAVVLSLINENDVITHNNESGLLDGTVQIDCYADTYAGAESLYKTVKAALLGPGTGNIKGIFLARVRDIYDNETESHRRSADFNVWSY